MKSLFRIILLTTCLVSVSSAEAKDYVVKSPDGHLRATVVMETAVENYPYQGLPFDEL